MLYTMQTNLHAGLQQRKKSKKGFTLVELVVVIAILAILALIAIPMVSNAINSANKSSNATNAQTVEAALKNAYAEAKSGTWNSGTEAGSITVDVALKHEGLVSLDSMNNRLKGTTDKNYYYSKEENRISAPDSKKEGSDKLTANLPLSEVLSDPNAASQSAA